MGSFLFGRFELILINFIQTKGQPPEQKKTTLVLGKRAKNRNTI